MRKTKIFRVIESAANSTFDCHKPIWLELLARLRLGLSQICE